MCDQEVAGTCEEASSAALKGAVERLVGKDLVDRPHEPVPQEPRRGQAGCENGELCPREEGTEPSGTPSEAVEALGPVEVEEADPRASSPEPLQRELRIPDHLEPLRGQVPIEQPQVRVPWRSGEARDPPVARHLTPTTPHRRPDPRDVSDGKRAPVILDEKQIEFQTSRCRRTFRK